MPKYDPAKIFAAVSEVLRSTIGLSLAGVMKSFPQDAENDVYDALRRGVSTGEFGLCLSDDDEPVPVYYVPSK